MKRTLEYVIGLFLLVYIFLTIMGSQGLVFNLQVLINYDLIPLMFWIFVMSISFRFLLADIGFFKLAAIMGIATGFLILTMQMLNNTSSFTSVSSSEHDLILEVIEPPDQGEIKVYKRVNVFFSQYVDSITIGAQYNTTYEIIGDTFIVFKCTQVSCVETEIELE